MKKALTIVLVVVLVLSIGITAYAASTDTDVNEVIEEFTGRFGFKGRGQALPEKELLDELKDLTSEEQFDLLESKLVDEEITQEVYDRLKLMIENDCTFDPPMYTKGGKQGFAGRGFNRFFDQELLDELKDLTTEEQLALIEGKLANEEITQEVYDKLKLMIENNCPFEPQVNSNNGNRGFNGKGSGRGCGNRFAPQQSTDEVL